MKFLDQARIFIRSGNGGAGCVSFRREKFVEFGGPDGGDGGRGGHVYVKATDALNTLIDYRYRQHFKGGTGMHGMGRNRTGGAGDDITLEVPVGTQIFDVDTDSLLVDLTEPGQKVMLAKGGNGGWGNARFKSSVNQAPRRANPGEEGEERWVRLRLKVIADAGLVGLPNAGKSTFLSSVSAATPKTADYPFTTLHPHLGVVTVAPSERFVLADLPGLIEGASDGAGLGHRFLGHVERCAVILHLIDGTSEDPLADYETIRNELISYGADLNKKPTIIVITKSDAMIEARKAEVLAMFERVSDDTPFLVSSVAQEGLSPLLFRAYEYVKNTRVQKKDVQRDNEEPAGWTP